MQKRTAWMPQRRQPKPFGVLFINEFISTSCFLAFDVTVWLIMEFVTCALCCAPAIRATQVVAYTESQLCFEILCSTVNCKKIAQAANVFVRNAHAQVWNRELSLKQSTISAVIRQLAHQSTSQLISMDKQPVQDSSNSFKCTDAYFDRTTISPPPSNTSHSAPHLLLLMLVESQSAPRRIQLQPIVSIRPLTSDLRPPLLLPEQPMTLPYRTSFATLPSYPPSLPLMDYLLPTSPTPPSPLPTAAVPCNVPAGTLDPACCTVPYISVIPWTPPSVAWYISVGFAATAAMSLPYRDQQPCQTGSEREWKLKPARLAHVAIHPPSEAHGQVPRQHCHANCIWVIAFLSRCLTQIDRWVTQMGNTIQNVARNEPNSSLLRRPQQISQGCQKLWRWPAAEVCCVCRHCQQPGTHGLHMSWPLQLLVGPWVRAPVGSMHGWSVAAMVFKWWRKKGMTPPHQADATIRRQAGTSSGEGGGDSSKRKKSLASVHAALLLPMRMVLIPILMLLLATVQNVAGAVAAAPIALAASLTLTTQTAALRTEVGVEDAAGVPEWDMSGLHLGPQGSWSSVHLQGGGDSPVGTRRVLEGQEQGVATTTTPAGLVMAGHGQDTHSAEFVIALSVLLPVAVVLLCVLVVVVWLCMRMQRMHKRERGARSAPGVGPLTTLLITDIANSTALWESLPEEVMDQALKQHHACLRSLLQRFNGYESATEGDSFILAFHCPTDAAKFALSAQVQLMEVTWPPEVLAHPDGQEVWVVPRAYDHPISGYLNSHVPMNTFTSTADFATVGGTVSAAVNAFSVQNASVGGPIGGRTIELPTGVSPAFRRSSWTSWAKSSQGTAALSGGAMRPAGLSGVHRTLDLGYLMSGSDLDADDLPYGGSAHYGSKIMQSFTSRMSTMLGLVPQPPVLADGAATGIGSSGAAAASLPGRASSRMGRLLRVSVANLDQPGGGGGSRSHLHEAPGSPWQTAAVYVGTGDPSIGGRLAASTDPRGALLSRGGSATQAVPAATVRGAGGNGGGSGTHPADGRMPEMVMRSKSFAAGLLRVSRGRQRNVFRVLDEPTVGEVGIIVSGGGGGGPGTMPGASAAVKSGSFTSGARSLLRQALSFNRRQGGSFHSPSGAAAAAGIATPTAASGCLVGSSGSGGGAVPNIRTQSSLVLSSPEGSHRTTSCTQLISGEGSGEPAAVVAAGGVSSSPCTTLTDAATPMITRPDSIMPYMDSTIAVHDDHEIKIGMVGDPNGGISVHGMKGKGGMHSPVAALPLSGVPAVDIKPPPSSSSTFRSAVMGPVIRRNPVVQSLTSGNLARYWLPRHSQHSTLQHPHASIGMSGDLESAALYGHYHIRPGLLSPSGRLRPSLDDSEAGGCLSSSQRMSYGFADGSIATTGPLYPSATGGDSSAGTDDARQTLSNASANMVMDVLVRMVHSSGTDGTTPPFAPPRLPPSSDLPRTHCRTPPLLVPRSIGGAFGFQSLGGPVVPLMTAAAGRRASAPAGVNIMAAEAAVAAVSIGGGSVVSGIGGGANSRRSGAAGTPTTAAAVVGVGAIPTAVYGGRNTQSPLASRQPSLPIPVMTVTRLFTNDPDSDGNGVSVEGTASGSPYTVHAAAAGNGSNGSNGGTGGGGGYERRSREGRAHSSPAARTVGSFELDQASSTAGAIPIVGSPSIGGYSRPYRTLAPILEPRSSAEARLTLAATAAATAGDSDSDDVGASGRRLCDAAAAIVAAANYLPRSSLSPATSRTASISRSFVQSLSRGLARQFTRDKERDRGNRPPRGAIAIAAVVATGIGTGADAAPRLCNSGGDRGGAGGGCSSLMIANDSVGDTGMEISVAGIVDEGAARLSEEMGAGTMPLQLPSDADSGRGGRGGESSGGRPTRPFGSVGLTPFLTSAESPLLTAASRSASKSVQRRSPVGPVDPITSAAASAAGAPSAASGGCSAVVSSPGLLPGGTTGVSLGAVSRRLSFLGLALVPVRSRGVRDRRSAGGLEHWPGAARADSLPPIHSTGVYDAHSQTGFALVAECRTWREKCREEWPPAVRPAPPAKCTYRGLRVRMGLHTGISQPSDVTFNPTTSHMAYGGEAAKMAKAVGDAAAGGMVLLSGATFTALVHLLGDLPGQPQAVFSGESSLGLGPDAAPTALYQLIHQELLPRLGYAAPLRNISLSALGSEEAPTGFSAISFMHVASASMLVAELGQPGVEALQQFKSIATDLCSCCGGYIVEASEGLCLAAFKCAAAALVWALATREALASHPWSTEVKRWYRVATTGTTTTHLALSAPATATGAAGTGAMVGVSLRGGGGSGVGGGGARGPRPRTGVHVGGVNVEVNAATGRLTYRGKVMNRTSRIAHKATTDQIVCSKEAWETVATSLQSMVQQIQDEQHAAASEAAARLAHAAGHSTDPTIATADGGDTADADDDVLPAVMGSSGAGGGAAALSRKQTLHGSISGGGSNRLSKRISPLITRVSVKRNSGPPSLIGDDSPLSTSARLQRLQNSSIRSVSAKNLSAAAAAAAALTRRVTSFSTRVSGAAPSSPAVPNGVHRAVSCSSGGLSRRTASAANNHSPRSPTPLAPFTRPCHSPTFLPAPSGAETSPVDALIRRATPSGLAVNAAAAATTGVASAARRSPHDHGAGAPIASPGSVTSPQGARHYFRNHSAKAMRVVASSPESVSSKRGGQTALMPPSAAAAAALGSGPGIASSGVPAASGGAGGMTLTGGNGSGGQAAVAQGVRPSLAWQALQRLVGSSIQLPTAKKLEARFLGSYSLKGVREEMRLFEVFWGHEEEEEEEDNLARGEASIDNNTSGRRGDIVGSTKPGDGGVNPLLAHPPRIIATRMPPSGEDDESTAARGAVTGGR